MLVPGGRSGWVSEKVRRYGVDYFGSPWQRRLIQQYPAGFPWLQCSMNGESDKDLKMRIRLVSFSNSAKPSAGVRWRASFLSGLFWCSFLIFN